MSVYEACKIFANVEQNVVFFVFFAAQTALIIVIVKQ